VLSGTPTDPIRDTSFTIIASDGFLNDTLLVTILVNGVNETPVVTSSAEDTAAVGQLFTYTAAGMDPDGTVPTITFLNVPSWLTPAGSTLSGTATSLTVDAVFQVVASDGLLRDTQTVTIRIDHPSATEKKNQAKLFGLFEDNELTACPVPAKQYQDQMTFQFQAQASVKAGLVIYDLFGTAVYSSAASFTVPVGATKTCILAPWNLKNRLGQYVATGGYLAIVRVTETGTGKVKTLTAKVAVAR
jgi:hypothetical protein